MKKLFELFFAFFKIGLFTFGGGYAMLPIIEDKCVCKKKWITSEEMAEMTVLSESTPGPIAINCATYVGFYQKGPWGSVFATAGVVLPSFIIILLISFFLDNFLEITLIANAFKGIKLAVGILIFDAGLNMLKRMKKSPLSVAILILSLLAVITLEAFAKKLSTIVLMLASAAIGLIAFLVSEKKKKGAKK